MVEGDPTRNDLDEVDELAERIASGEAAPFETSSLGPGAASAGERRGPGARTFDPGSLIIGVWFVLVGLIGAVLGADIVEDLPPVVIPISFAVTGLALLLPKRPAG